jgi:hypothetical protein
MKGRITDGVSASRANAVRTNQSRDLIVNGEHVLGTWTEREMDHMVTSIGSPLRTLRVRRAARLESVVDFVDVVGVESSLVSSMP